MKDKEYILLATAIRNRERIDKLLEMDPGDVLTYPDTLAVFHTIREMIADGIDPDFATLAVRLQDMPSNRAAAIISELSRAETTIFFDGLLSELKRYNTRSRMMDFCSDFRQHIQDGATLEAAAEMLAAFQDKLTGPAPDTFASMRDMAAGNLDDIFKQHAATPTGISVIDAYLPGLYAGQLVIIAARPGIGKTSLALQMAANLPGKVLFFSLEMSRTELFARRLSGLASVEGWRIETGKVTEDEAQRVLAAQDAIRQAESDLVIIDRLSDINIILNTARRFIRRGKISAMFIDYLTLITGGRGETQNLKISDITRRLKSFATENGVPIIVLSQLNRAIEYHDREPILSDLRDSGAIEQDADVIIFIHETETDETCLIIGKNRKGRTGKTPIDFEKCYTQFKEVS